MQKEEQLRRRDPKAHTAMILGRREREMRLLQQYSLSHNPSQAASDLMTSTQRVRSEVPMIATADMLRPPSTAPDASFGTGRVLNAPSIVPISATVSRTPHQPEFGHLSASASKTGNGASFPASKQTQSSLLGPQGLSETPKFTTHDLQNHIDDSVSFLANNQIAQLEGALREAIGNLFGEGSLDGSSSNKGLVPEALEKATREDFQAIIKRKSSENRYEPMPHSLLLTYARELRRFIIQKAKSEEEHRHLASGLKHLLDKESINPKLLLKVLSDKLRPAKPNAPSDVVADGPTHPEHTVNGQSALRHERTESATATAEETSGHPKYGPDPINSFNGHKTEMNGIHNNSKKKDGGQKHSIAGEDEHQRKKTKRAPASTPKLPSSQAMDKLFKDFLTREAARSSGRGP